MKTQIETYSDTNHPHPLLMLTLPTQSSFIIRSIRPLSPEDQKAFASLCVDPVLSRLYASGRPPEPEEKLADGSIAPADEKTRKTFQSWLTETTAAAINRVKTAFLTRWSTVSDEYYGHGSYLVSQQEASETTIGWINNGAPSTNEIEEIKQTLSIEEKSNYALTPDRTDKWTECAMLIAPDSGAETAALQSLVDRLRDPEVPGQSFTHAYYSARRSNVAVTTALTTVGFSEVMSQQKHNPGTVEPKYDHVRFILKL